MAQQTIETDNFWDDAEVISRYTRADALRDGVLVDITATAREAGFRFPVAMTCGLHAEAVAWNEDNRAYQDESGRLWDVLTVATYAMRSTRGCDRATATVARIPNTPPQAQTPRELDYTVHIGPGDAGEPVITLMFPGED